MNRRTIGGMVGVILGGVWLFANLPHYSDQGIVAIGMPLLILGLGASQLVRGLRA